MGIQPIVDPDALTDTFDTGAIVDNATTTVEQQIDLMGATGPAVLCTTSNSYTLQVTVSMCLPSSEYQKLWTLSLSSISSAKLRAVSFSYVDCWAAVGAPTQVTAISGPPRIEVMLGRTTPTVGGAVAVRVCPNLDCAVLPTDIVLAALPTVSLIVPASLTNLVDCSGVLSNGVSYNEGVSGVCKCECPGTSTTTGNSNSCSCTGGKGLLSGDCQTCPTSSTVVSGVCTCSGTKGFIGNVCSTCPTGSSIINGVCTCSGGRSIVNGVCTCPSSSTFIDNECVCSGGRTLVNNVCTCPSTSTLVGTGDSAVCRCSGSQGFINGVCSTCPSGSSVVNGVCTCSGGRSLVNGVCTCPSTSTFDGSACVCSGGQTLVNNVYTCPSTSSLVGTGTSAVCRCAGTEGFINGVCSTCPSGSSVVNGVCTCSGGRSLVNGVCTCPSTSTFDGSACVCSGGQTLANNVCTCPSTSALVGSGSSAVCHCSESEGFIDGECSTCPPGSSAVDAVCTCSPGLEIVNGQCTCPCGQEFTSGKCVSKCFWTTSNVGYDCPWTDPKKSVLALNEDCKITAPAVLDNYVADERTNKYDGALEDPVISISATKEGGSVGVTAKATWKEYFLTPTTLENKVTFETFGVFDLEMKATDYGWLAKCSGCVAIVDKYPPTAEIKCQATVTTTLAAPASYADGKLAEAIAQEEKFTAFYSTDNVKNNDGASGANERCDDVTAEMQDFFASSASNLASLDTQCFDTDFGEKVLAKAPGTSLLTSATQSELDELQCTRCCSKSLTLQEYYYDYKCGTDPADAEKKIATSDQCAFNYCLNIPGDALVEASAAVTESVAEETTTVLGGLPTSVAPALNVIHRSITCTAVNKGCSYTPTLGDLLTHKSSWGPGGLEEYDVEDFVYWGYAVDTENRHQWSDSAVLTFTNTQTVVYVETWTGCASVSRDLHGRPSPSQSAQRVRLVQTNVD